VSNGPVIAGGEGGFSGWNTYTGTFMAQTGSDLLNVVFTSVEWAYAD
jgi:hypothetical protein